MSLTCHLDVFSEGETLPVVLVGHFWGAILRTFLGNHFAAILRTPMVLKNGFVTLLIIVGRVATKALGGEGLPDVMIHFHFPGLRGTHQN